MIWTRDVKGRIEACGTSAEIKAAVLEANKAFVYPFPEWNIGTRFSFEDGYLVVACENDLWEDYMLDLAQVAERLSAAGMNPHGSLLMETHPWADPPRFARVDICEDGTVEQKIGRIVYE